jgi:lysophospholipase L1-like esterase
MKNKLLLPLALVQGLWVLRRTPRLPVPKGRAGRHGNGSARSLRVVGVGDSIMAGTGVREQCHSLTATFARLLHESVGRDVEWRVHGANGATSFQLLHELAPQAAAADVYLISVGVNDATRGIAPDRFAGQLRGVFDLLRRKAPESDVVFAGVPPLQCFPALPWPLGAMLAHRATQLQAVAAAITSRYQRALCFNFPTTMPAEQFASDSFHPAEVACQQWAEGLLALWPEHRVLRAETPHPRHLVGVRSSRGEAPDSHRRSA